VLHTNKCRSSENSPLTRAGGTIHATSLDTLVLPRTRGRTAAEPDYSGRVTVTAGLVQSGSGLRFWNRPDRPELEVSEQFLDQLQFESDFKSNSSSSWGTASSVGSRRQRKTAVEQRSRKRKVDELAARKARQKQSDHSRYLRNQAAALADGILQAQLHYKAGQKRAERKQRNLKDVSSDSRSGAAAQPVALDCLSDSALNLTYPSIVASDVQRRVYDTALESLRSVDVPCVVCGRWTSPRVYCRCLSPSWLLSTTDSAPVRSTKGRVPILLCCWISTIAVLYRRRWYWMACC
jgi:hypothetical protein